MAPIEKANRSQRRITCIRDGCAGIDPGTKHRVFAGDCSVWPLHIITSPADRWADARCSCGAALGRAKGLTDEAAEKRVADWIAAHQLDDNDDRAIVETLNADDMDATGIVIEAEHERHDNEGWNEDRPAPPDDGLPCEEPDCGRSGVASCPRCGLVLCEHHAGLDGGECPDCPGMLEGLC